MDTARLAAFVKVVDVGSVTRAANLLNVAQPGLSQQILALENEFKTRLLDRSPRGVTATPAGQTLYRHAQRILRQMDEALINVREADRLVKGHVSVGLTAWSRAVLLAPDLVAAVRAAHPGILLQVFDIFPLPFSEMVLKGSLDMAYIYGGISARGLDYVDCGHEDFVLALPPGLGPPGDGPVSTEALAALPLILPPATSFQRRLVDRACATIGEMPNVVTEVVSIDLLTALLAQGMGGAVLPIAIAELLAERMELRLLRMEATMDMPMVLCTAEGEDMSEAAGAVQEILLDLIGRDRGP
ncbi:MAG: LysR substrate-binding domain-containing protein [Tropicimonas sp.]|uniref:LysR substrate-binding domain-containing protein n=1 Tax=Tropicimonas sp. TaxID=2067044 RepID=UPI003A8B1F2A